MGAKQPFGVTVVLLGLLLCISWTGAVYAHGECVPQTDVAGEQPQEVRPAQSPVASKAEDAGLKKALTTRNPRRTDIPDYLLVMMLALVGVVVISRRNVSEKGKEMSLRGHSAREDGKPGRA